MEMDMSAITEEVRSKVANRSQFDGTVKFCFETKDVLLIDGRHSPYVICNEDKAADCTVRIKFADFVKMVRGELNGTMAYMTGKLKVEGNLALAVGLSKF
jgi:putative sterol carrier protein